MTSGVHHAPRAQGDLRFLNSLVSEAFEERELCPQDSACSCPDPVCIFLSVLTNRFHHLYFCQVQGKCRGGSGGFAPSPASPLGLSVKGIGRIAAGPWKGGDHCKGRRETPSVQEKLQSRSPWLGLVRPLMQWEDLAWEALLFSG